MSDVERKLNQLKKEIESQSAECSRLKGQLEVHQETLKKEFKLTSLDKAKQQIEDWQADYSRRKVILEKRINQLWEKMNG